MKEAQEAFGKYLAQNSLKDTPQRRAIFNTFLEHKGHLSAEEFYHLLHDKGINVGQATVYRTLKLLCSASLINEVHFGDGLVRYETSYGSEHHDHLICESCSANIEVLDEEIEELQRLLAARYDYTLTSHRLYLYGICPSCRKKK